MQLTPLMISARAERFPRKKDRVASRLDVYKSRGIEGYAAEYKKTGIVLITHASKVPILAGHVLDLGHFSSDYATPQQMNHKRKPSETLMHQHRRPFHVDETSAEFSQPNVTTEIEHAPIARTEGTTTDVERSREDDESHRHELPCGGPGPGRALSESDRQQSPNRGTDASTDNRHANDRIHTFETLRATTQGFSPSRFVSHQLSHDVQEVRQHPQASGDTSSPSFTALSVPNSMAIRSHIRDAPILDSRSIPESDVPIQERSGSPQSRQQLETDATPGTREEPNTTANNINSSSAQESPMQNLSPIQSHGHGLSHNATEISYPQRHTPPLHPPTAQVMPDSTATQSHVIGTPSGLQPESTRETTQEPSGSPQSYRRSEAYRSTQSTPSLPSHVNPDPLEQSQSSPGTTPPMLTAAKTTGLLAGVSAGLGFPLEPQPENAELQGHGGINNAFGHPHLQGPQNQQFAAALSDKVKTARKYSIQEPQEESIPRTPSSHADLPQLDSQSHTQHLGSLEQPQDQTSTARSGHRADTERSSPNLTPPFSHGLSESIEPTQADPDEYLKLVSMQSMTEFRTYDELLQISFTMNLTPSEELIDMDFSVDAATQHTPGASHL